MKSFLHWLQNDAEDCGLFDPPLPAQQGLNFLIDYLLGEDWYVTLPECIEQTNSAAVYEILYNYSRKFRKEIKHDRRLRRKALRKSSFRSKYSRK